MNDLLTIEDIAKIFGRTKERAKELVKLPGFPAEAPSSTPRNKLWIRREVRAFIPLVAGIRKSIKKAQIEAEIAKADEISARSAANRRHHRSKRRSAMLQRTPPWADLKAIERIYREAVRIEDETGMPHAVDHIIPLQGRNVSGLHVESNLQVIPAHLNRSKGNRFEVEA